MSTYTFPQGLTNIAEFVVGKKVLKDTVEFKAIRDYLHLSVGRTHRYKYTVCDLLVEVVDQ